MVHHPTTTLSALVLLLPGCTGGVPRRAVLRTVGAGVSSLAVATQPSFAFFESKEQGALTSLATTQPKLRGLITEVAEVKRKRIKMAADFEDDAYVVRFARSILDPASKQMALAAPAVKAERAAALPTEFADSLAALYDACRAKSATDELDALEAADKAVTELLELAKGQKFDTKPRGDDINTYEGATGVLYNKFLFRSG